MKEWTQPEREAAIARLDFLTSQRGALQQFSNGRKTGYAKWAVNVVAELREARELLEGYKAYLHGMSTTSVPLEAWLTRNKEPQP